MTGTTHLGELALRRHRAGETVGGDAEIHAGSCAECRARLRTLDEEQRRFEQEISFDRFSAGVERAARSGARRPRAVRPWMFSVVAMAAAVALVVTFAPDGRTPGRNGTKGGGITVRVSGNGNPQRTAAMTTPEALAAGERVMIGYEAGAHRFLMVLSVDDRGAVTPIYPEAGRSVRLGKDAAGNIRYLPDSLELTGAGNERLIVLLTDDALDVEAARRAVRSAYEKAKGDILHLPPLELPGEQFQRTFIKP
jgi:hypothetical protein